MQETCGVFVVRFDDNNEPNNNNNEPRILAVHATHASWKSWGIPKGLLDAMESPEEAAARELEEETGLTVDAADLEYLGSSDYKNRRKKLQGFWVNLEKVGLASDVSDIDHLRCRTLVTKYCLVKPFPEVDAYRWMTLDQAMTRLHQTQRDLIPILKQKLGLKSD